ncbi:MAG TPA: hypothetical protein VH643_23970 [Gemmataceae bacterium]
MLRPYLFLVRGTVLVSCVIPFGVLAFNLARSYHHPENACRWPDLGLKLGVLLALCLPVCAAVLFLPRRLTEAIEQISQEQGKHLGSLPERWVDTGILGSAGLSLLLELAVIRWQSTVFEVFAFYKNFGLLACFLGLGLGYALARRPQIPLLLSIPLLAWQIIVLLVSRYGPEGWNASLLRSMPVTEQLHMGLRQAQNVRYMAVLILLGVVFVLTALALVPVGQLCGSLLDRRPKLRAYGLNLLGSLLGVAMMFGLSVLWAPPVVWFGLCFLAVLAFQAFRRRPLLFGLTAGLAALIALAWPGTRLWEQTYSPYQLIERGPGEYGRTIRAAGHYYQRIHDFAACARDPNSQWIAAYYAFPYRVHEHPGRVAVVGAGTGNDVAMAVRMGARQVDAIEIDPAILAIGTRFHPDDPYHHPRVRPIVNDARSFLRTSPDSYDMIVYGLLDSHTLLSHGSNVRLDSFVYTVEAFREARARLTEGGTLSLAFSVLSPELGRKIFLMLQEAFDGKPPACVKARYDGAVIFLQRKGRPVELPAGLFDETGFADVTALYADPDLRADLSTDDWPFFYMPRRVYPLSYVVVVGLILLLSLSLVRPFFRARPHSGQRGFFLLGAGFMLVETKGISELGLTFGNTWKVIGVVIAAILLMAFLANCVVRWLRLRSLVLPYVLLLASLLVGLLLMKGGGFLPTPLGRLLAVAVLTCPLFFSGMVFSTLLRSSDDVSGAMSANLMGAMCGGLLEYNAMYFGFLFLYWVALAIYGASFLLCLLRPRPSQGERILVLPE